MKKVILWSLIVIMLICTSSFSFASERSSLSATNPIITIYYSRNIIELYSVEGNDIHFDFIENDYDATAVYQKNSGETIRYSYGRNCNKIDIVGYTGDEKYYEKTIRLEMLPCIEMEANYHLDGYQKGVICHISKIQVPIQVVFSGNYEPFEETISEDIRSFQYHIAYSMWDAEAAITLSPDVCVLYTFEGDDKDWSEGKRIHFALNTDGNPYYGEDENGVPIAHEVYEIIGEVENVDKIYLMTASETGYKTNGYIDETEYNPYTGKLNLHMYLYTGLQHITIWFENENEKKSYEFDLRFNNEDIEPIPTAEQERKEPDVTPSATEIPVVSAKKSKAKSVLVLVICAAIVLSVAAYGIVKKLRTK